MRVCIDIQPAVTQRAGIGRYTLQLVRHLKPTDERDSVDLVYFDFRRGGVPFDVPNARLRPIRWCPGRLIQWAWKTFNAPPYEWFAPAADIYHFTNFILPPLRSGRSVVSIHDVSFLRYPEYTEERNLAYLTARIRDTVRRADAIVTISRFSGNEVCALLDVEASRVHPIHLGIGADFSAPAHAVTADTLGKLGIDAPYILTVGTVEPRKNLAFLVEVFEHLSAFDGKLVIAGMLGWKCESILERIRRSPRAGDIHYIRYVPDEQLPALYAGASVFLLPSHYEGFGFTPLEAMACGTPVLSSTGGSLPEVLGDAALILDTFDADLWAERCETLLTDSGLRQRLVSRGHKQAALYRWGNTARETWDVYRTLA